MTIQEIHFQLIVHFCDLDTFSKNDIDKIRVPKEQEDQKWPMVQAALADMVEDKTIKLVGENAWVLDSPMENMRQELNISMKTGLLLSATIETFCKANQLPFEPIDPFNIHEGHIISVLHILNDILTADTA